MGPPFPPPRPPRRKPGEVDPDEQPRKGRCLIREDDQATTPKPVISEEPKQTARVGKSTDYQLINGIRINKGFFWLCFSLFALVLIVGACIPAYLILNGQKSQTTTVAEAEQTAVPQRDSTLTDVGAAPLRDSFQEMKAAALKRVEDPASMVEEIMEINGQVTGWGGARTYSVEGIVKTNHREYDMNLFVKAPNQVRQVLTLEDMKITSIYNGLSGELLAEDFNKQRSVDRRMSKTQCVSLLMSAMPTLPLWQYSLDASLLEFEGKRSHDGVVYYVISNESYPPYVVKHYFDVDTMTERHRHLEGLDDEGQSFSVEITFSDYQRDGDFYAPMKIEVLERSAIEVASEFDIEKWRFNHGLLPSLFSLDNS
ncbi:hypothetical protein [Cerasicoccus frondis]|uniref:hypothetical protein n=1 Tax=Cerasicoccus frondis TaxID=490090 RepID=UPI002852B3D9|nr:hypothetical protein [Cerasicoccus frondis]